jgi:short-subunit dehydrogenase
VKRVLVIGATSAIAEHCARLWAQRGDRLFLVGRDAERLQSMASDLRIRGAAGVDTACLDLNEVAAHAAVLDAAESALGAIDVALVAHGTLPDQAACERSVDLMLKELQTNGVSTVALLMQLAQRLEARRSGVIAVISSPAGDRGRPSNYVYGSAKAMVTTFAEGLRHRLHDAQVSVVTIKPGFVDTPMTASFRKGLLWAQPDAVASGIVKAIDERRAEVYLPGFWRAIMAVVRLVPDGVVRKFVR